MGAVFLYSIAAQVITFPLSAFYFHQFPVYFLVSNLLIIVPSAIIMYSGLAYLLLPQIPYVSKFLAQLLEDTIIIMNKALAFIEHLPFAVIGKLWIYTYEYILLYILLFCLFYFLYDKKPWLLRAAVVCCLLLSISISLKYYRALTSNNIAWLNLGKHQGIVFKNGCKAVIITDLHSKDKTYQYAVQPYLDSCKVTKVTVADFKSDIKSDWLDKSGNLLQFRGKTVLVLPNNRELRLSPKLNADYIYLSGKSSLNLAELNESFNYKKLIINSSVSNRVDTGLKKQAAAYAIKYTSLKRNISLITVSN